MFFPASLLASIKETKPNTTKANIHPEHENNTAQNKHRKLKPRLVASYALRPGNGADPILQLPGSTQSQARASQMPPCNPTSNHKPLNGTQSTNSIHEDHPRDHKPFLMHQRTPEQRDDAP